MNNTFSAYIAAFDELNILTSTSYYSASGKDMTSKVAQIADDILSLLIRAYQQGITATADMLAYDLTVDVGSMEEAIYEVIDGKTFEDRIADHVIAGDLSGLQTLVESEYHRVFNAAEEDGAYPIPIDNYIKIVKGVKFYGRYMDDSYVIHKDKEFLKGLLIEIVEIAHDLGITVNLRKTRICKLSEMWRFLQIQYSLTDTGRVIHKIHPKRLTGMRRKAKKLALILSEKDFDDWFRSWFNGHCHYMSKLQRSNMLDLCKKLKEEHYYGKTDFS